MGLDPHDRQGPMKTIVVGYDGSPGAERALDRAAALAKAFGSTLVVTVVEEIVPVAMAPMLGQPTSMQPLESGWDRELQIERARAFVEAHDIPYEIASPLGSPAPELVDVADEHRADLIVVGTNDPGLLERLFGGSVSGSVARRAHCDVLVVHPERDEREH